MFISGVLLAEESTKIWEWPKEQSIVSQLWWILTWPISFFLYITTPDCRKYPRLFPLTFFMCIIWIGIISYLISWLITVIGMFKIALSDDFVILYYLLLFLGDTLNIPDSVMGLTFLAAGMSTPEGVSSVLVTNQGNY